MQQHLLPFRKAGIGNGADQEPLVLERQRQGLGGEVARVARIGAEDAGKEAEIDAGSFRIDQQAALAERLDQRRHRLRVGVLAILLDPSEARLGRIRVGLRLRKARSLRRSEGGNQNDEGDQVPHTCLTRKQWQVPRGAIAGRARTSGTTRGCRWRFYGREGFKVPEAVAAQRAVFCGGPIRSRQNRS